MEVGVVAFLDGVEEFACFGDDIFVAVEAGGGEKERTEALSAVGFVWRWRPAEGVRF